MNKIKSFFMGIVLLTLVLASVFVAVLVYRANDQTTVKTYIFQMGNPPDKRAGPLERLVDINPDDMRNSLIQKYVAEYFKVIPGNTISAKQKKIIAKLSTDAVYSNWLAKEVPEIENMAKNKMFRNVWVDTSNIQPSKAPGWFTVPYFARTWTESNNMDADIILTSGEIGIKVFFTPGINPELDVRKYLENGGDPSGLFIFRVLEVKM